MIVPNNRGERVSLHALKAVPLEKPPGAGHTWYGTPHHRLLGLLSDAVGSETGRTPEASPVVVLSRDSQDMVASLAFRGLLPDKQELHLGVIASQIWRTSLRLYCGSLERGIGTSIVVSEYVLGGRHGPIAEDGLAAAIKEGARWFDVEAKKLPAALMSLKQTFLKTSEATMLLVKIGERGILPWSHAGSLIQHVQGRGEKTHSRWFLNELASMYLQKAPPLLQLPRGLSLYRTLLNEE